VGGLTEKLVNAALTASREVKNKTNLSDGTTSVSYAVIQLLKEITGEKSQNILLMGLGKIGTLTLKNLKHYLPQHTISLINRNEEKAAIAANEYNVDYASYSNQTEALKKSNILIVATSADKPLIFKKDIQHTPIKMVFDLSVPSNIGHDVKELSDIKLFNIDELSQLVNQTMEKRKNEVPVAEKIIHEHFEEFKHWEQRRKQYTAKAESTVADTSLGEQL
jgi:glutamyl-tRNA reductase